MSSFLLNETKQKLINTKTNSKKQSDQIPFPQFLQSKNIEFNKKITTDRKISRKQTMIKGRIELPRQPLSNGQLKNGSTSSKGPYSENLANPQPNRKYQNEPEENIEATFGERKSKKEKKYRINLNYKDADHQPSSNQQKKNNNHVTFELPSSFTFEKDKLGGDLCINGTSSPQKQEDNPRNSKRVISKPSMISLQYPDNQQKDGSHSNLHNPDNFQVQQSLFQLPHKNMERGLSDSFNFAFPSTNFQNNEQYEQQNQFVIFQKAKGQNLKSSVNKSSQGQNMFALQIILEASGLYDNYLKKLQNRKQSLDIMPPEADLIMKQKLPRQFFYKPQRIIFNKPKDDLSHDYNYNGYNKIYKINSDRTKFFYQDLKLEQLHNMRGLKSNEITFPKELKINKNIEYDNFNKRFYFFSNEQQKILVYSEASQEMLCSVKVKNKVYDPHLFIHQVNNRNFLLIIGGYCRIEKDIVQGSKFIQIFQLMRWEIQLSSKVINLIIGRISPIILTVPQMSQNKILILGGNTIAQMTEYGDLNYDYEKDMNESTNLTGLSISSHQIIQLFDIKEQAICYNHSVKLSNPLSLHDGCTIPLNNAHLLLLPSSNYLFQLKIFNKQINIIQGKSYPYLPKMKEFQRREICLRITKEGLIIYRITNEGLFQIITQEDKIQSKCYCLIY